MGHPVQPPCPSRVTQSRLHRTVSRGVWNISREGDSTASLRSLGQGSVTLRGKKFFLIFSWSFLCFSLCPSPLTFFHSPLTLSLGQHLWAVELADSSFSRKRCDRARLWLGTVCFMAWKVDSKVLPSSKSRSLHILHASLGQHFQLASVLEAPELLCTPAVALARPGVSASRPRAVPRPARTRCLTHSLLEVRPSSLRIPVAGRSAFP